MGFSFNVISSTPKGVYVKVVRADSNLPWTQKIRVLYKVRGLRFVDPQSGTLLVGPSGAVAPKQFIIRFLLPFNTPPYVSVLATGLDPKQPDSFKFDVKNAQSGNALVSVQRSDPGVSSFKTWTQPLTVTWTARSFPTNDVIQTGSYSIGPQKTGPFEAVIPFADVYRNTPQAKLSVLKAASSEVFEASVIKTAPDGMTVRVTKLSSDGSTQAGWTSALILAWKTYPDSYDLSALPTVVEYSQMDLLGLDVVEPMQMNGAATTDDCAQVCLQNPECKSYTFASNEAACQAAVAPALCSLKGVPVAAYPHLLVKNPCMTTVEITSSDKKFNKGRVFSLTQSEKSWSSTICADNAVMVGASAQLSESGTSSSFSCVYPSFDLGTAVNTSATTQMKAPPKPESPSWLDENEFLNVGSMLRSENGVYTFQVQQSSAVLYEGNAPIWSTKSDSVAAVAAVTISKLVMQSDGNLVLYGGAKGTTAVWDSKAPSSPKGSTHYLVRMQDDGNLVVYQGNTVIWDSDTCKDCASKQMWTSNGWWYQGMVNQRLVGLSKKQSGGNFFTYPDGGAVTGAVLWLDGQYMHVVMNSANNYYCSSDGENWRECNGYRNRGVQRFFVETDLYKNNRSPRLFPATNVRRQGANVIDFDQMVVSSDAFDISFQGKARYDLGLSFMCTKMPATLQAWTLWFGGWSNTRSAIFRGTVSTSRTELTAASGAVNGNENFVTYSIKLETVNGVKRLTASANGKFVMSADVPSLGCDKLVMGFAGWENDGYALIVRPIFPTAKSPAPKAPVPVMTASCPANSIMAGWTKNAANAFDASCLPVQKGTTGTAVVVYSSCYPWKNEGHQSAGCPVNMYPTSVASVTVSGCSSQGLSFECRPVKF